jgi:CoA:oxalate CoA-transferase
MVRLADLLRASIRRPVRREGRDLYRYSEVVLPRPLDGVRVLEFSQIVAGPACGRLLADLGAEVIKVESPSGDLARSVPPEIEGVSALYAQFNAGKRHVCVDIRSARGGEVATALADRSDVLLENFRPGALADHGLGYRRLSERNPRLIYLSISGFGQAGPWSERRAHAPLLHAEGGPMEAGSRLRGAAPQPEIYQHADLYSGYFGVSAVCAALYQRDRTGRGQHLDLALAEALLYASDQVVIDLLAYQGRREFDTWTYPVVTTANGEVVCLIGNPLRLFDRWMTALGAQPGPTPPLDEQSAKASILEAAARFPDALSLQAALAEHRLISAVVQPATRLLESEWAISRGVLAEASPGVRVPAAAWRSTGATIGVAGTAGKIGEHTTDVLTDVLGLADDQIEELRNSGAVR